MFACGAAGGLLGWLLSANASGHFEGDWRINVPTALLGGGIAAGVGIYLIANSDTSQLARCIFLAALCGISWKLVLETGRELAVGAAQEKKVVQIKRDLDQKIAKAEQNPTQENVDAVKESTVKLAEKLPAIRDSEVVEGAQSSAQKAIEVIADKKPDTAPSALKEIAAASKSGGISIESSAKQSLQTLSTNPDVKQQTKENATTALQELKTKL